MPKYTIRDPTTGQSVTLTGESAPTEAELTDIFAKIPAPNTAQPVAAAAPTRTWTDTAVDAIPTVAGGVGGVIGGIGGTVAGMGIGGVPGAVGGAAVGGGLGEAIRQLIERVRGKEAPATPGQAALGIGGEAALQAGSELAGQGVMKGAGVVGHALMDNAVRPAMSLVREFPDVVSTLIKERLPVGRALPGMASGSQQAKSLLRESAKTTRGLLTDAGAKGVEFNAQQVAQQPITELARDIGRQPISEPDLKRLSGMVMQFLDEKGQGAMTPSTLKDLKQAAQSIAKPIFKAQAAGNVVGADQAVGARFNAAIAGGAKTALETIPGMAASEARTQSLIGATRALKTAETRRLPLWAELAAQTASGATGAAAGALTGGDWKSFAGGSVAATTLTRALLSPRSMSRGALTLTQPMVQELLRQVPRGTVAAILTLAAGKESQGSGAPSR